MNSELAIQVMQSLESNDALLINELELSCYELICIGFIMCISSANHNLLYNFYHITTNMYLSHDTNKTKIRKMCNLIGYMYIHSSGVLGIQIKKVWEVTIWANGHTFSPRKRLHHQEITAFYRRMFKILMLLKCLDDELMLLIIKITYVYTISRTTNESTWSIFV